MRKYPSIFELRNLISCINSTSVLINGTYVPCRPEGYPSIFRRFKLAWTVFTGKGDVVIWPEDQ